MLARIGVMRALNRAMFPEFNPDQARRITGGRRKLKRDRE